MNWKAIEQAILAYANHRIKMTMVPDGSGDTIVEVRQDVNISELARAIDKAITVKVD